MSRMSRKGLTSWNICDACRNNPNIHKKTVIETCGISCGYQKKKVREWIKERGKIWKVS